MTTISPQDVAGPLILTLDIGSSSIRTSLFDRLGRMVEGSLAARKHQLRSTAAGGSEANPETLLDSLFACIDQTLADMAGITAKIRGVASCMFVSNVCGLDEAGRVAVPLMTYADTRAAGEVAGLQRDLDKATTYHRTGCRFHPSYLPAQLRWLARTQPERFQQVSHWLSFGELVSLKLFGQTTASTSVASWSGLLDRHALRWDAPLLAHLPLEAEQLSPLADVAEPLEGLRPEFAERWPALREVPWFPTIGDGAAANIGSGCVSARQVALTIGTTSALRVVIEPEVPPVPDGLWCYRVDKRRSLLGGALSEGGNLPTWMRQILNTNEEGDLNQALAQLEPDGHGLTVLPFLTGERSPGWVGDARATIHGLSLATRPLHILQAGLEAIAYRIAQIFIRLQPAIKGEPDFIVSGGALQHWPVWTQMIADVLGRPLFISDIPEASSRGAALLALEALGICPDFTLLPSFIVDQYPPRPEHYERYQAAITRQEGLYDRLLSGGLGLQG